MILFRVGHPEDVRVLPPADPFVVRSVRELFMVAVAPLLTLFRLVDKKWYLLVVAILVVFSYFMSLVLVMRPATAVFLAVAATRYLLVVAIVLVVVPCTIKRVFLVADLSA